jgi:hypothetical protein
MTDGFYSRMDERRGSSQEPANAQECALTAKIPLEKRPVTKRRVALVILGMHRSGTSALAGVMALLGATPPKTLMPADDHNSAGYWESIEVCRLNDRILESGGSSWHDWRRFNYDWFDTPHSAEFERIANTTLASEYDGSPFFVIKDPRICRLAPFWLKVFDQIDVEPRIIIPIRSPLEVAFSLQRVHGLALNVGILCWLRHVLDAEFISRNTCRCVVYLPDFLKDWRSQSQRMAKLLEIKWPRYSDMVASQIDRFVDGQLLRFNISNADLDVHPLVHEWVISVYRALRDLADDRASDRAKKILDEVRSKFEIATSLFGRALVEFEDGHAQPLRDSIATRDARIGELEPALDAAQAESLQLRDGIATRDARIGELEPALDAAQAESLQLREEILILKIRNSELGKLNNTLINKLSLALSSIELHRRSWLVRFSTLLNRQPIPPPSEREIAAPRLLSWRKSKRPD